MSETPAPDDAIQAAYDALGKLYDDKGWNRPAPVALNEYATAAVRGAAPAILADDRERIKAALPELISEHRTNLAYTPPEGWGERWVQFLGELQYLIGGDS
jgi:hypothetical protein